MKTRIKILALFFLLFTGMAMSPEKSNAQHFSISFQVFYDELSPYGTWVYRQDFGYVWIPDAPAGFFPYATDGYWVFTDLGWTWVSLYPWGWAPFHYGRWYIDPLWGPLWVPGYEWSPGWVVWRSSRDYCGWAPLGPGISLAVALSAGYAFPAHHWRFVRYHDFGGPDIHNYYVTPTRNITIINQTTVINNVRVNNHDNTSYIAGPSRNEAERNIGRTITPVAVKERTKPGQNYDGQQLEVYRPRVEKYDDRGQNPKPAKAVKWDELQTKNQMPVSADRQKSTTPATQQKSQSKPAPAVKSNQDYQKKQSQPAQKPTGNNQSAKSGSANKEFGKQPAKAEPGKSPSQQVKQQTGKQQTDKQPTGKQSTDKQPTGKQSTGRQQTEKQQSGKSSGNQGKNPGK